MTPGTIDPTRLRQQLNRLSRNPYDLIQGGGNYMPRAPGMGQFPEIGQPQFEKQLIQKKTQPSSWWEALMKPLFMLEKPLHLLGRAFSSGEYAVSSFLRSMIRASRNDAVENPFVAGLKGFAAGFHDDAEYQTRMTDILNIMGWRPEEGTKESFTKESLGFLLGILADPITYASFGATRAFKLLPSSIKAVAGETGIEVASTFAKGQAASKSGEKVVNALKAVFAAGSKTDETADLTKILREGDADAISKLLKGDAGSIANALRIEGEGGLAKIMKAEDAGKEALIQLTLPGAGMSVEELIQRKTPELIDSALQVMGRKPTQAAREWFVKDGYRTLLDRGGLKFMGKTIASTKHLGPRMSGLTGLVAGNAISRNMPLTHMMMESKFAKKGWEAITAPIRGAKKVFGNSFIRASKLAGVEPDWLLKFEGGLDNLKTEVKKTVANLLGSQREAAITIGGRTLKVPTGELDFLTRKESRLLLRMLTDADSEAIGLSGDAFKSWVMKKGDDIPHHIKELFKKKGISDERLEAVAKAGVRIQDFFQQLRQFEIAAGLGEETIRKNYMARVMQRLPDGFDDAAARKSIGNYPFWDQTRRSHSGWLAMENAAKNGNMEYKMVDDLIEVLFARISPSMTDAYTQDFLEAAATTIAKHPNAKVAVKELVEKNPELVKNHPELVQRLAESAWSRRLPKKLEENTDGFFTAISEAHAKSADDVIDAVKNAKFPAELSDENAAAVIDKFKAKMRDLEGKIKHGKAEGKDVSQLEAILEGMKKSKVAFSTKVRFTADQNQMGRMFRQWRDELGLQKRGDFPAPKLKSKVGYTIRKGPNFKNQTPKQVLKNIDDYTEKVVDDLNVNEPFGFKRRAERFKNDYSKLRKTTDEYVRGFKELSTQGGRPGVPSKTHTVAQAGIRARREVGRVRARVKKDLNRLAIKAEKGKLTVADEADARLAYAEWTAHADLMQKLPSEELSKKLMDDSSLLIKRQNQINKIKTRADQKGINKYLGSLSTSMGNGKSLANQSAEGLDDIERVLFTKGKLTEREVRTFIDPLKSPAPADEAAKLSKFKVTDPATGEKVAADSFHWGKGFIEELESVIRPSEFNSDLANAAAGMLDKVTNPLKKMLTIQYIPGVPIPRLAFHTRNSIDLLFRRMTAVGLMNTFKGVNLKHIWGVTNGKQGKIEMAGRMFSYDDLRQIAKDGALFRHDFGYMGVTGISRRNPPPELFQDLGFGAHHLKRNLMNWADRRLPKSLKAMHPESMGVKMENFAIFETMMNHLNRGVPVSDTVAKLQQHLFNYNNMTRFEKQVMNRLVMFYPFQRQAVPFVISQMKERPGLFGAVHRLKDLTYDTKKEEALVPQWVRDFPMVRLEKKGKQLRLLSLRNQFTLDTIADIAPGKARQVLGMVNPAVGLPMELILGNDLYFGKPIYGDKKLQYNKLASWVMNSPMKGFLDARVTKDLNGKDSIIVNATKWHLLRRLHGSRLFRELNELGQSVTGDKKFSDYLLNLGTGLKIYQLDLERQELFLNYDASKIKMAYDKALRTGDKLKASRILKDYRISQ